MTPHNPRVSASRIPALFDAHRYMTKRMLWEYCAKGIRMDEGASDAIYAGMYLETAIMAWAADRLSVEDAKVEATPTVQDRTQALKHATLPTSCLTDGLVRCPSRGLGIISCKNVDSLVYLQRWKDRTHGVPPDVEMQLQTEISVLRSLGEDIQWGVIAALVGGRDLHLFERAPEPTWEPTMAKALEEFFTSIENNDPPAMDYLPEEFDLVKKLWPSNDPEELCRFEDDEEKQEYVHDTIISLINRSADNREAERSVKSLKAELADMAGTAGTILVPGARLKITKTEIPPQTKTCDKCGHEIEVKAGFTRHLLTPKEL